VLELGHPRTEILRCHIVVCAGGSRGRAEQFVPQDSRAYVLLLFQKEIYCDIRQLIQRFGQIIVGVTAETAEVIPRCSVPLFFLGPDSRSGTTLLGPFRYPLTRLASQSRTGRLGGN
jgi:hypothetical protein